MEQAWLGVNYSGFLTFGLKTLLLRNKKKKKEKDSPTTKELFVYVGY